MSAVSPELERALREMGLPDSAAYRNLRAVIQGSPVLLDQMNAAAVQGHLAHFALLPGDVHAGATYHPERRTISLKAADLNDTTPQARHTLTFLLGHETQHAVNRVSTAQALGQFAKEATETVSIGAGKAHDYTPAMQKMLAVNRLDEASSHIAGWNALVSHTRQIEPKATLENVVETNVGYVRRHFVDTRFDGSKSKTSVKAGIRLNNDLSITPDARNVEALGRHYFDMSPGDARLGPKGKSDYTNYCAAGLVSTACQNELVNPGFAGRLTLDMKGLKLDHALLADNGITLGTAPGPGVRCAYRDAGAPGVDHHFDHTTTGRSAPINRSPDIEALPPAQSGPAMLPERPVRLDEPSHPGHGLFKDAQADMRSLDARMGRASDQHTDNMAACLAVSACRAGLRGIDHVEMGTHGQTIWALQGKPGSAFCRFADASIDGAMVSVGQTSLSWDAAQQFARSALAESQSRPPVQEAQMAHALMR